MVKDGVHEITSEIVFSVIDVQNTPPIFMGSQTGIISEDDPVGTNVLTIKARDGDSGQARRIIYTLEENPNGYFAIDKDKGDITIDKPINRWGYWKTIDQCKYNYYTFHKIPIK